MLWCKSPRQHELVLSTAMKSMLFKAGALALGVLAPVVNAAFGYTSSGGYYTIDAGSSNSFTFKVSQSSCDITSLYYYGVEVSSSRDTPSDQDLSLIKVSMVGRSDPDQLRSWVCIREHYHDKQYVTFESDRTSSQ